MKIAVVGAGISGIYAAHRLAAHHDVTLYEANRYLGGHTDTHHVTTDYGVMSVDTGFIVFNEHNYPLFSTFLDELGVESQPSDMSFSVSDKASGFEYNATNLTGLLCRRSNLVRPGFYRMLIDIIRFYKRSPRLLGNGDDELMIGEYLDAQGYSREFVDNHIIPMASALWSSPPSTVRRFPARYFVAFLNNHRMLQLNERPLWRTIKGGSSRYVEAFERNFSGLVRLYSPVREVEEKVSGVVVRTSKDSVEFDNVILACHSDQASAVLHNASDRLGTLLAGMPYQYNEVILHTDVSVMPDCRKAWASWNVVKPDGDGENHVVTYYMNLLQAIDVSVPLLVSLNAAHCIDKEKILLRRCYHHPVYTPESLRAQRELNECNGRGNVYLAGAYLGWGFHEDGVRSAQQAVDAVEAKRMSYAA